VSVADPQDAYDLLQDAIACDDPVLFFEPKRRYHLKGEVDTSRSRPAALGTARVVRQGSDATVVTFGGLVQVALAAADAAADEGVSLEVIDLRSLAPIDWVTVAASVRRTGRAVVTHEAPESVGLGAELAAGITERCFSYLEHAPVRVTGFDIPYPPSKLEKHHLPDLDRLLDGVDAALGRPSSYEDEA
jgi:2-oxoisovalerate dehydrogenase E1 component beta subunit